MASVRQTTQLATRRNPDPRLSRRGATVVSTNFGIATQQIRVVSEVQGWLSIGASTTVTVGSNGLKISANVEGEYFTATPGQVAVFNSTSTSTGYVSITEMA